MTINDNYTQNLFISSNAYSKKCLGSKYDILNQFVYMIIAEIYETCYLFDTYSYLIKKTFQRRRQEFYI